MGGGCWSVFVPFSPLSSADPWAGWRSAPRNHLCSASSVGDSPALLLSLLSSSSRCQNRCLARLLLSLIQFPLLHIFFLPASTTFAFVMGNEWLQLFLFFVHFFGFSYVTARRVCFNRERRGEKMSPFIPFSQRTIARRDDDGLLQLRVRIQ